MGGMKRALLFAGQGAQAVGMGKDLAESYPECRELFDRANAVLGYDLAGICFNGPIEELTKTSHCQPGIFVVSAACLAALRKECGAADAVAAAGLSLGEWTALYAAGVLTFEDTVKVLAERGRLMQAACEQTQGAMVSVLGLDEAALRGVCAESGATMANLNSPGQIVLSGERAAVERAAALATAAGAKKAVMLNVAGAYHSPLMAPAAEGLREVLAAVTFREPACPVVSNVTGRPHGSPDEIRELMVRQVTSPVQWIATIEWCMGEGIKGYVECGPGKILGGLVKRIDKDSVAHSIQDLPSLQKTAAEIKG